MSHSTRFALLSLTVETYVCFGVGKTSLVFHDDFLKFATYGRLRERRMIVLYRCHQSSLPAVTAFAGVDTVAMYNVRSRCCFQARCILDYISFQGLQVTTFCTLGIVQECLEEVRLLVSASAICRMKWLPFGGWCCKL